ncbi:hypothetical protein A3D77_05140 [Candidatus Gottesmanbacteria bacterium RIFCSPHIGHO2_02_FULL_39_11]|uniref:Transglycosylase SLT domain-containing protein n=1 Tax=Candidatus Gottesmanbacteria bacterium RIFCSPHIGHO2_02_FULL_39_11 TaxID=1798382 RepID=A0A1F5ZN36_9BACT|nr:MAG: hypothetical protein A3D77_05140 [Candidatus Gottesmanbacteria bacterium RIFCSPHIGHO2_02_FULL_39_11]
MPDDVNTGISGKELSAIKRRLESERDVLIEKMREGCPELYAWFAQKHIDLKNLHQYSKQITAALFMAGQMTVATPAIPPPPTPLPAQAGLPPNTAINSALLTNMDPADQGLIVWNTYREDIMKTADKYEIQPQLIFATIMTESMGNPRSYRYESRLGEASYGLGQILYSTALSLGYSGSPEGLYDPQTNIDLIGKYHRRTLDRYENMDVYKLTTAYNAGNPFSQAIPGHINKFKKWYDKELNV